MGRIDVSGIRPPGRISALTFSLSTWRGLVDKNTGLRSSLNNCHSGLRPSMLCCQRFQMSIDADTGPWLFTPRCRASRLVSGMSQVAL